MAGRRYKLSPLAIKDTATTYAPISGATVTVYLANTTTAATCYANTTTASTLANSQTTTNAAGYFEFFMDSKDYAGTQQFKIVISKTGYTDVTYDYLNILPDISGTHDSGFVDIRAYGAVGDGSTDDTTAIQNALNSNYPIEIPDLTFIVTGLTVSGNKRIRASRGATLKFKTAATPAPIVTCTGDMVNLDGGLTLNGNSTATTGWYHNGANNATVQSLYITGCSSHGLSILGVSGDGAYYNNWYNLISKNNGGSGVKIDGNENPSSRANVNNFFGGQVSSNTADGFTLTNCKGILVLGVDIETNGGWAYNFTTCLNQAFTGIGGWIESNTTGGINIDATTKGVQFYGTRLNQSNELAGAGINNGGNIFLLDNAGGVLTKWMELIGVALRDSYIKTAVTDSLQTAGSNTLQLKVSGDTNYRYQLTNAGGQYWGSGSGASDVNLTRNAAGLICSTKLSATGGLGVGNSAAATTLGSVAKKIQIFDTAGNSLGYLPVYDAIT